MTGSVAPLLPSLRPGRGVSPRSALASVVALVFGLPLAAACSDGELARADGPPAFNPSPAAPYTPAGPAAPGTAAPSAPAPGEQTPGSADGPAAETPDEALPLEPSGPAAGGQLGAATMGGTGSTSERYFKTDVTRNGQSYFLMANGWGPGFESQSISWNGTAFTVDSLEGTQGPEYQPASYPTVFCGVYSDSRSRECGLPAPLDSIGSLRTGWSWRANGNDGEYNAAYDIWLGNGPERSSFSGYLMVWYREPPGQQPAGRRTLEGVTVQNVPGTWDIWEGFVGPQPIINWVRAEDDDTPSMEFDVMDFVRDARARGLEVPGTHVLSVAVGFEIWNGPIRDLESVDFYVDVQ